MKKLDKNRNVTQEYLDYVSNLERQDLETFYIGADLLVDRLNNILNKAIEYIEVSIEEGNYFEDDIATDISEPTYDKYVNSNSLLDILKGVDKE